MTQMLEARKGHITEEMEKVALIEGVTPEFVREGVAKGHIVIPKINFAAAIKSAVLAAVWT